MEKPKICGKTHWESWYASMKPGLLSTSSFIDDWLTLSETLHQGIFISPLRLQSSLSISHTVQNHRRKIISYWLHSLLRHEHRADELQKIKCIITQQIECIRLALPTKIGMYCNTYCPLMNAKEQSRLHQSFQGYDCLQSYIIRLLLIGKHRSETLQCTGVIHNGTRHQQNYLYPTRIKDRFPFLFISISSVSVQHGDRYDHLLKDCFMFLVNTFILGIEITAKNRSASCQTRE